MLRLLKHQVAVSGIGDPDKSAGGLWIPDEAKERTDQGVVRYIGEEVHEVKVGDYVLFSGWTGTALHVQGEGLIILLPEDQIICIVHQEDTKISGLFHQDINGDYFPATYESTMNLVRTKYWELPRRINLKNRKA